MLSEPRWRFFTDQVMGGTSTGGVTFVQENGQSFARMSGRVSTANRGGFIQMRQDLVGPVPKDTTGIRLVLRGNDQRYFVHLRSVMTRLPWHFYQAGFDATTRWAEVLLPLVTFAAAGSMPRGLPVAAGLTSVAVVAYGRDHDALIDVREVGFF